jgi:hypothetical protein
VTESPRPRIRGADRREERSRIARLLSVKKRKRSFRARSGYVKAFLMKLQSQKRRRSFGH